LGWGTGFFAPSGHLKRKVNTRSAVKKVIKEGKSRKGKDYKRQFYAGSFSRRRKIFRKEKPWVGGGEIKALVTLYEKGPSEFELTQRGEAR